MNITKTQLLTGAGLLITGLLLGWLIFGGSHDHDPHAGHDHEVTTENGEEVWTCSMHPSVREDGPGSCPICGMDLIPASSEEREDDYSMVMTEASMQLANIQATPVIRERPKRELHLPGRVEIDERRISYVTAHFAGRIQDVEINFTGAPIREGDVMATIYSPELVSAQRELLEAVKVKDRNPGLYESAVRKFRLWEFTDEQIQEIVDRGEVMRNMEILSPVDGFVMKRNVVDEQHVTEGSVIYEVANLDQLWVTFDAYEEDMGWLQEGSEIEFRSRSNPGSSYTASVDYIDPTFNPQKRTIRVRADVENADHTLRPEMIVRGVIQSEMQEEKLLVPASAVLWTGPRSLVYVKDTSADTPRFEVKEVELGSRTGDYYIIEEGLESGQEVVFNGAFRIDSEFQLADRFSMMNREPGTGAVPGGHDHGQMGGDDMDDHDEMETQQETDAHDHTGAIDGATDDFREDFKVLLTHYLDGKEALFESDMDGVSTAFQQAAEELESIGLHRMQGDAHMRWMEQYEAIEGHLNHILEAEDMEVRREGFALLSHVLIEAVNNYGIPGMVYHQYCPMEDANWLSRDEQIENPYAPDTMPSCGEVIERIE
ncbi:efflux RND transporter periplasmic adaptor subunit [Rhodohalobacter sp. SW132]|uniref:efflux RND transporter periplasmic adaptor subunit n=1 Tax=Rhodohalobacter sp. SW132 TaxID=2293433 RepID=UPI000E289D9B|nr:efflux RND transporter periplasmic adaptor subunit [Rhodohalobacter sp. SW132]REL38993.1 efflux RND transporter periplasmic adaptor subunit [Rhodohalobacter sp. SW132]